jgi:hypothetical protein
MHLVRSTYVAPRLWLRGLGVPNENVALGHKVKPAAEGKHLSCRIKALATKNPRSYSKLLQSIRVKRA